jgi:hypothetical protein
MPSSSSFLLQDGNGFGGGGSRLGGRDELELARLELVDVLQDLRQPFLELRSVLPRAHRLLVLPLAEADEDVGAANVAREPERPAWALNLGCGLLLAASLPVSAAPRRPGGGRTSLGVDDVNRLVLSVLTMLVLFSLAAWTTGSRH